MPGTRGSRGSSPLPCRLPRPAAPFCPTHPQASLAVSATQLTFSEQATAGATFNVSLGAQPNRTVTVTLSLSNASVATVTPSTLTFVSGSFPEPQVVTVTPVADPGVDVGGRRTALITLRADSEEQAFRGLTASDVTVVVLDADTVGAEPAGPGRDAWFCACTHSAAW